MRPSKAHFVTACQQLLALGAVLAVLAPAASIVSLDVVREMPAQGRATGATHHAVGLSAYTREARRPSLLPGAPTDAKVRDFALTAPSGSLGRAALGRVAAGDGQRVVSRPESVEGYGGVGVTWGAQDRLRDGQIGLEVRTLTDGAWSDWQTLEYDAEHAPDPDSAEGRHARPGTDILFVGSVDQVQVRATTTRRTRLPGDMRLSVVSPGRPTSTVHARAAIDAARLDGDEPSDGTDALATSPRAAAMLAQETFTPKPVIYSRAQWGADEKMRDKSSLHYFEVHAGFVHHTVNANDYTRSEVPGILRSIYAYHTRSRGWSDIGYNFLVDRFGRIWEGRYGGVDRPVVGAHTLNYNDYSFAMSAIGNYDIKKPSKAMVHAYGSLFAWKLSLHGVDASSTKQWVGSRNFQAINGHRDAASTACPGRYLYAKIPKIRKLAAEDQRSWAGRELHSDLAGTVHPDLLVRRASDGRGFILPTGGLSGFKRGVVNTGFFDGVTTAVASPDLTGDGYGDVLAIAKDGSATVRPGDGQGRFGAGIKRTTAFAGRDLVAAVGDLDGNGTHDLVARKAGSGILNAYLGGGAGGFTRKRIAGDFSTATQLIGTGDVTDDGRADLLVRDVDHRLWLYAGTGGLSFGAPVEVPGNWGKWTQVTGFGDYSGDGRPDLVVRASGPAYVLPANGDGTFGRKLGPYDRINGTALSSGGDLVGTAAPDVTGRRGADLVVWPNAGTVDLEPAIRTNLDLSTFNTILTVGDWDRDGYGDVVLRRADGALLLRRGDGTGHFAKKIVIGTGFGGVQLLAGVGDMTGDGYPDLMGQPKGGSMRIYPGKGTKGLKASYVAHSAISAGRQVAVGRWDADGAPDSMFVRDGRPTVFPGNGPGGLTNGKAVQADLSKYDWVVGVSDLKLTGHSDLVVRNRKNGRLFAIQATAAGLSKPRYLGSGTGVYDLAG